MSKRALALAAVVVAAIAHWCSDMHATAAQPGQATPTQATTWKDHA